MLDLFNDPALLSDEAFVNATLEAKHYLGPSSRGFFYRDRYGVMVFANPSSRRLPQSTWLELVRWCITGNKGAGTRQWCAARRWLMAERPDVTTVVSYSDPSVGHTGALYRACNWLWAPTWHRLRPPPTGNGDWGTGLQATKDRWIAPLRRDWIREALLTVEDESLLRRMPWASYREPSWRGLRATGGGGDYKRWTALASDKAR